MKRLIAVVGLVLLVGCQAPPAEMTEAEIAQIEAEVTDAVQGFSDAILRLDADEGLEFWANTERFAFAGDGILVSDYEEWAPGYRQNYEVMAEVLNVEFGEPQIFVLAQDAASYAVAFEWTMINTEGDTISSYGSWLYVMKYLDGRWKAVQSAGTHLYE